MTAAAWSHRDLLDFRAAEHALAAGDHAGAERIAAGVAGRQPKSAQVHRLIATARRRRGDLRAALAAYQAAEAIAPDDPDLLVDHAGLLDRMGAFDDAIARYRHVLAVLPAHAQAMLGLALSLKHAGRLDDALAILSDAVANSPRDDRLWQARGAILRDLGESDLAAQAFDEALRLAPGNAASLHGRARVEEEAGRPAGGFYERARQVHPADRALLLSQAVSAAGEGRIGEAVAALDAQVRRTPDWIEGQVALARLRWQHDGPDQFDAGFRQGIASLPAHGPLRAAWLGALARAGRHDAVMEEARRARVILGASPTLDRIEAASASAAGDIARADTLLAGLPVLPDASATLHLTHLLRTRRPDAAARLAEALLEAGAGAIAAPYLDIAWRQTGNGAAEWLSGRAELVGTAMLDVDLDALGAHLRVLHAACHPPIDQSLRSGTQSEGPLLSRAHPIIRDLRSAVLAAVDHYAAGLLSDPRHPFLSRRRNRVGVGGSWTVRLTQGGFHVPHVHPDGWISSAFYVALPDGLGTEIGQDSGWLTLGAPPADIAHGLGAHRTIRPRPGMLVMFPSIMWHGTRPFDAGERLTAAFDFVPRPA